MAQYLSPGVYVKEVSSGVKPIEGVGTSTGAFVGIAEKGPIGKAEQIANWTQFVNTFGHYIPNGFLAYAVNQFFSQGGTRCFVVRTCHYENIQKKESNSSRLSYGTLFDKDDTETMKVMATSDGTWGNNIKVEVKKPTDPALIPAYTDPITNMTDDHKGFTLVVKYDGDEVEIHPNLNMEEVEEKINGKSSYITVEKDSWTKRGVEIYSSGRIPKMTELDSETDQLKTYSVKFKYGNDGLAPASKRILNDGDGNPSIKVMASAGGGYGNDIKVEVKAATTTGKFMLVVTYSDKEESFDNLTIDTVEDRINGISSYIKVEKDKWLGDDGNEVIGKLKIPVIGTFPLIGGKDDSSALWDSDFIGDESAGNGLHAFDVVDDINIVAIPDRPGDRETILGALSYCENEKRRDCFFIADPPQSCSPTEVADFKNATGEFTGQNAFNSSFGALYYPWVKIVDPLTGGIKDMPPSGTIAGTYAYTDSARGVHKSPAGITEGKLGSVTGIERIITKSEHDGLNPIGINVIRSFPTSGICIWGTRTISADPEWRYLNIRRLFLFLEESIDKGSQWVVFEPNSPALWGSVKRNLTAFLLRVWRDGALFGTTPEEAFFVKVDEENNPEEVRNAGQLIIDVGVAPIRPAEFVIIRISQKTSSK